VIVAAASRPVTRAHAQRDGAHFRGKQPKSKAPIDATPTYWFPAEMEHDVVGFAI
jgi:hypothetical protein